MLFSLLGLGFLLGPIQFVLFLDFFLLFYPDLDLHTRKTMALVPLMNLRVLLGVDQWVILSLDGRLGDVPRHGAVRCASSAADEVAAYWSLGLESGKPCRRGPVAATELAAVVNLVP